MKKPGSTIRRTPDAKPSYSKTSGRTSGLGTLAYFFYLLELNETLPKAQRMTDAEIARQMRVEFPGRGGVANIGKPRKDGGIPVSFYRDQFNRGKLLTSRHSIFPASPSFRYTDHGLPYDGRTGRVLSKSQITQVMKLHEDRKRRWTKDRLKKYGPAPDDQETKTKNRTRKSTSRRRRSKGRQA